MISGVKAPVLRNEPLSKHTTFRIGGPADFFIEALDIADIQKVISYAKENQIDVFVLGSGSNVLFSDSGYRGIVLKLSDKVNIELSKETNILTVNAGAPLASVIKFCIDNDLSGLETLAGIPSTVGGSIWMNASSKGAISDNLVSIKVIDENANVKNLKKEEINFSYRKSDLLALIIIQAEFLLNKRDKEYIIKRHIDSIEEKKAKQPLDAFCAGCVFKNPETSNVSAGELIEKAGLKGFSIGGAQISKKHANYIVNENDATSDNVKNLITHIKDKILKEHNIKLQEEILIVWV